MEKKQVDLPPPLEVAKVLREGLKSADVSPENRKQMEQWCQNEEDFHRALVDHYAPANEAYKRSVERERDRMK